MSWLQIARMALELLRAVRDKTQRQCPNPDCPLKLGKQPVSITKASVDEQVRRQRDLYAKNHPKG